MSTTISKKDLQTDQEVRWCPGCGDYAILNAVQSALAKMGVTRNKTVFVSGIGCSSRFPYYMNTYGFHTIHGRAPAVATGLKVARPDLDVWVVTGDGDGLSIGGNHMIHLMRRNVGLKVLLFNNRIYGLTKGQYSPTSERNKRTVSTPMGSVDRPFNPLSLAIGAGATFIARTVDVYQPHLQETLARAAEHRGTAFIEIYQNCNIFNDKAFTYMTERDKRNDNQIMLEHGEPLVFGTDQNRGIQRGASGGLEVTTFDKEAGIPENILRHDTYRDNPAFAFELAQLIPPEFPTPLGIFRQLKDVEDFETGIRAQIQKAKDAAPADLEKLIRRAETWQVS